MAENKEDLERVGGVVGGNAGTSGLLNTSAVKNVKGADKAGELALDSAQKHASSFITPEQIEDLRQQALQAIGRGRYNLGQWGTWGGMNTKQISGLNAFLGNGAQMTDMSTGRTTRVAPLMDLANAYQSATDGTEQNKAIGLAELNKVVPSIANVLGQAENQYTGGDVLQSPYQRGVPNDQAYALSAITNAEANRATNALNTAVTTGVNPTGGSTGTGLYSARTNVDVPVVKLDNNVLNNPNYKLYAPVITSLAPVNVATATENLKTNPLKIDEDLKKAPQLGATSIKSLQQLNSTAIKNLENMNQKDLSSLNYGLKDKLPQADFATTSGRDSFFNDVAKMTGLNSSQTAMLSNIRTIANALPPDQAENLVKAVANGEVVNIKGYTQLAKDTVNKQLQDSYATQTASEIARNSRLFTGQGMNGEGAGNYDTLKNMINQQEIFQPNTLKDPETGVSFNQYAKDTIAGLVKSKEYQTANTTEQMALVAKKIDELKADYQDGMNSAQQKGVNSTQQDKGGGKPPKEIKYVPSAMERAYQQRLTRGGI